MDAEYQEGRLEAQHLIQQAIAGEETAWARGCLKGTFGTYLSPRQVEALKTNPHLRGFGDYVKEALTELGAPISPESTEKLWKDQ
jgi:hypothetical protein